MSEEQIRQHRIRLFLTIGTFIALAIAVYALRQQIGSVIKDLGKVNTLALLLIIPLEVINYDSYARLYRSLLAILGKKVSYWPMFRVTLELNFVNHILPSGGVSGISYFNIRVKEQGVSTGQGTLSQVMKLFLLYISYQPLLILGVFFLAIEGHVNNLIMTVVSSLITLLVVGTILSIYVAESRSRIRNSLAFIIKTLNSIVRLVRRNKPDIIEAERVDQLSKDLHNNYLLIKQNWRQLKMPFVYTSIANITEVAALYAVYIAFGQFVNIGAVILAYAVANFAGLLSVLPAGIGVYEGLMTAVLVATGIPASLSIPVTIMYRVVSMFIQLTPGYILYQHALGSRKK